MKNNIKWVVLLSVLLLSVIFLGGCSSSQKQANAPVSNNQTSQVAPSKPPDPKESLKIVEGWRIEHIGDKIWIKGSVKNVGTQPIFRYHLTAEFSDKNKRVVDSGVGVGTNVNPGNESKFELMHKDSKDFASVRIYVERVEFK